MSTELATTPGTARPVNPLRQVTTWILSGFSEPEIVEAAEATWPDRKCRPLIVEAIKQISKQGDPDAQLVKGFVLEGTRIVYQRALEGGDLSTALKALKQLRVLSKRMIVFQKKKKPDAAPGWFTLQEMARIFGTTPFGFHKQIRPHVPAAEIQKMDDGKLLVHCRAAIDAYAAAKVKQATAKYEHLLNSGDSPNSERYRGARADMAEIQRDQMRLSVIRVGDLEQTVFPAINAMRESGLRIELDHGKDAGDHFREAVDDFEASVKRAIEKLTGGAADPDEPAPKQETDAEEEKPQ